MKRESEEMQKLPKPRSYREMLEEMDEAPKAEAPRQESETLEVFWDRVAEIRDSISDEDLRTLPKDGARNYRHYLYSLPKDDS